MKAIASPNIAFIKYWGKKPFTSDLQRNLATNASLSMTLSMAKTQVEFRRLKAGQNSIFTNDLAANPLDTEKILEHLERVREYAQTPNDFGIEVRSLNNFPQGTGLASSASFFCALTLAALAEFLGEKSAKEHLSGKLRESFSALARRGSGSACRSVAGGFMKWQGDFAVPVDVDWKLHDTVLIFSKKPKLVSSSQGHDRATSSPLFAKRLDGLAARLASVEQALEFRDLHQLGALLETEALELHEIAATSLPPIDYLQNPTMRFLAALSRLPTRRNFYFTLDAGPNVHILSQNPVDDELKALLADSKLDPQSWPEFWKDHSGTGPQLVGQDEIFQLT